MGNFVKGDIVVINFPFSDLTGAKRRPALVLCELEGSDVILCQITGQSKMDKYSVKLSCDDYIGGNLKTESIVRPNKIFTADKSTILYLACKIGPEKMDEVTAGIINIIVNGH